MLSWLDSDQERSWLASALEASWAMAETLLSYPQLADLLAERHEIIGSNWQNSGTAQFVARYLGFKQPGVSKRVTSRKRA